MCAGRVCSQAAAGCLFQPTVWCASVGPTRQLLCGLSVQPGCQCDRQEGRNPPLGQPSSQWVTLSSVVQLNLTVIPLSLHPDCEHVQTKHSVFSETAYNYVIIFVVISFLCLFFLNTWLLHNPNKTTRGPVPLPISHFVDKYVPHFWHVHPLCLHRWQWRYWVPVLHEWGCLWPIQPQAAGKIHRCPVSAQG